MDRLTMLFRTLLEISLGTAPVIALFLLARPLLKRRYTAQLACWVWLAVALRLLIPYNIALPRPAVYVPEPPVSVDLPVAFGERTGPVVREGDDGSTILSDPIPVTKSLVMDGWTVVASVWALGCAAAAVGTFGPYVQFRRRIRRWSKPETDEGVLEQFRAISTALGVDAVRLMRCQTVCSPMVLGFFRPILLLPGVEYPPDVLEAIFRHELCHAKGAHLWQKLVLLLARTVHWFDPLVWLMVRRADRDLELACDEAVVAAMDGAGRADYSRAILDAVEAEARVYAPLTSYFYGGKAAMLERLRGILDTEAKKRGVAVVALAAVAVLSLTGAFSVTGQADREAVDGLVYSLRLPPDMTGKLKGSGDVWGEPVDADFYREGLLVGGLQWREGTFKALAGGTEVEPLSMVIDAYAMTAGDKRHHYYQVAEDLFCDLWFQLDQVSREEAAKIVGSLVLGGNETPSPDGRRSLTCLPVQAGMCWFLWDVSSGGRTLLGAADTLGAYLALPVWSPDGTWAAVNSRGEGYGDSVTFLRAGDGLTAEPIRYPGTTADLDLRFQGWNEAGDARFAQVRATGEGQLWYGTGEYGPDEGVILDETWDRPTGAFQTDRYALPIPADWTWKFGGGEADVIFLRDGMEMGRILYTTLDEEELSGHMGLQSYSTSYEGGPGGALRCKYPLDGEGGALMLMLRVEDQEGLLQQRMAEALTYDGRAAYTVVFRE